MSENLAGITVIGASKVALRPDVLVARLGAEITARSVQEALARCSAAMSSMSQALREAGLTDADLATTGATIQTAYGKHGDANGWRATQDLTARLHDLPTAGDIIANAIAHGSDAARMHDVSFAADNSAQAATAARKAAFADAREKAEQFAQLAGRELGGVVSIKELDKRGGGGGAVRMTAFAGPDSGPTMPVEAGNLHVTAGVEVTWALI